MLDAQNRRTDVQSGPGLPGSESQESEPKVQTEPKQDGTPILIDPARKYVLNKTRPDDAVFGSELLNRAGRGMLFDKVQSESQKKDSTMAQLQEQLNEASAKLQAIEREQSIRKVMNTLGIVQKPQGQQQTQAPDNPPGDDLLRRLQDLDSDGSPGQGFQETQQPTSAQTLIELQNFIGQQLAGIEQRLASGMENKWTALLENQQQKDSYGSFLAGQSEVAAQAIRSRFPDLSEQSIKNIVDLANMSTNLTAQAVEAAKNGDHDSARELLANRQAFDTERARLEAEAMTHHRILEQKKEIDQVLEAETQSMLVEEQGETRTPIYDSTKKREKDRKAEAESVQISKMIAMKNSL